MSNKQNKYGKNNVAYGGDRIDRACLGCKFFYSSASLCGAVSKTSEASGYNRIVDPAHTTCGSFALDKSVAPKV